MPRTAISTTRAPAAIGPYSQAIRADGYLFCSGQLGLDPATGDFVAPDVAAQAEQALRNLGAVLEAAGLTFGDVVKTTIFLADIGDFAAVNGVYGRFVTDPPPARSTVAVAALPKGGRVEIEATARLAG
ncbi:MAG TPA: RidA family protein [Candidatus Limnocylindrales bacterium]|jgi:2-iminobutanoate/2-iminopropanoate deaminase